MAEVIQWSECQDHSGYLVWLAGVRTVMKVVRATNWIDFGDEAIVRADARLHVVTDPRRGASRTHAVHVAPHRKTAALKIVRCWRVAVKQMHWGEHIGAWYAAHIVETNGANIRTHREANILGIHVAVIPRQI